MNLGPARMRVRKLAAVLRHPRWWRALRWGVAPSLELAPVRFAHDHRTVIDVGAGRGQFALFIRGRFPDALVFSFEPVAASFRTLERVTRRDPLVVRQRVAAGRAAGEATMHVTADADSSSLLPLARQAELFAGSEEVRTERVRVERLDDLLPASWERPALLKVDVQGAELDVLAGAVRVLDAVDEALIELSYVELYRGQPLADAVVAALAARGFQVAARYPSALGQDGAPVQSDVRFVRRASDPRIAQSLDSPDSA